MARPAGDDVEERLGVVGVDAEVVGGPDAGAGVPAVVVAEGEQRHAVALGVGGGVVEPVELVGGEPPGVACRG